MPDTSMAATMAKVLPTMVTMDTPMATTTMARGPLMPSPLPLLSPPLMLMLTTDTTDIPLHMLTTDTDMPTTDTTDTHTDMASMDTMARGLLMPSLLLMLDTCMDTTDTDIDTDMPTTDTTDILMATMDTTATESNHLDVKILRI